MRALFTLPWVFAAASAFSHATPAQEAAAHNFALLIVGAFFPALSLYSGVGSFLAWRLHKKHSSPAFVPFVGPIVLSKWVLSAHKPLWVLPLVWLSDLGTIAFLWVLPRLISEAQKTSASTRVAVFEGTEGAQSAVISIHSTGRYLLEKKGRLEKKQRPGKFLAWELGELGDAAEDKGTYLLKADHGWSRTLQPAPEGFLHCLEDQLPEHARSHSIANWRFRAIEFNSKREVSAYLSKLFKRSNN